MLQPYIRDIMEQIEKGQSLFRVEREIRNRKGRGRLQVPCVTPKEKSINNVKQLQEFVEAVNDDLTTVIESVRQQEDEFESNQERIRKEEEEKRQDQLQRNTRSTGMTFQNVTSTPLRGEPNRAQQSYQSSNQNRQANRGVFFKPNPTHHSYTQATDTNSNDEYEDLSNDSTIHDTDISNRISPSNTGDTEDGTKND